jgi:threonine/homoserine/homoserine lactone efflux protein
VGLELLGILVTSFVVGLSGALMPGPLVTLAIAESARSGFSRGPAVVLGHAVVELVTVVGLLFGVSQVVQSPGVKEAVGILGGLVLLWMAYGMGRGAWRGDVTLELAKRPAQLEPVAVAAGPGVAVAATLAPSPPLLSSPVMRGGAVSISNPYWLLWWATVGASFVSQSLALGLAGLVAFYVGHILSDLGWISLVAAVVSTGRRALSQGIYRAIILFCAGVLALLGTYFLWSGGEPLLRAAGL